MEDLVTCEWAGVCGGCAWIDRPYSQQIEKKLQAFRELWKVAGPGNISDRVSLRTIAPAFLRDRVDLILTGGKLGFFDVNKKSILDITFCPQLSEPLQSWLADFRKKLPVVDKGSLRLRVSPRGTRGLWLDFATLDVKRLLDERTWLESQLRAGIVVEMGQKRKRVGMKDGKLRLLDPELDVWHSTYVNGEERPLFGGVGGFSQPGQKSNRVLIEEFEKMLPAHGGHWLELGSGNGNFTLPLLSRSEKVSVIESDALALQGLRRVLTDEEKVRVAIYAGNFQEASPEWDAILSTCEGIVADPPRSGLGRFTVALARQAIRPPAFVYISCFAESLVADAGQLALLGYGIKTIVGIDQFPQSPHCEWIAQFVRG